MERQIMQQSPHRNLLLVDFENIPKVDLSLLDESFRAIIFVGAGQNPPRASRQKATAHKFERVDFHKISGLGKNALDFHIAFELGRTLEAAPETSCFVLSRDKGFDPLLLHLKTNGFKCLRVSSIDELVSISTQEFVCPRCKRASTVEHHGGRWCSNCGRFASPPDPTQLPSRQLGYVDRAPSSRYGGNDAATVFAAECGWCHMRVDMAGGIYDDGEWMCGDCVGRFAT